MLTVLLEYIQDSDCSIRVYRSISLTYSLTGKDFQYNILKIIIPIMLALCLMLSSTYYAKNYAGMIGQGLPYSRLFSRGKIFTNFADWSQFANIFPLKLYGCMVIY